MESTQMENQVREISLRHLFWKVILGWKCLIVCAVLFAILLPGVKYAKDAQAYKDIPCDMPTLYGQGLSIIAL